MNINLINNTFINGAVGAIDSNAGGSQPHSNAVTGNPSMT